MNEQIKEVIRKADSRCSETRGVFDEILVKMVVQECIEICRKGSDTQTTSAGAADKIIQHFGMNDDSR